jgi:hypothetical protein
MQFANQPITILGKQKEEGKHDHYPTTDRTIQIQPNLRRKEKKRNEKKRKRTEQGHIIGRYLNCSGQ